MKPWNFLFGKLFILAISLIIVTACHSNPYYQPDKPHHTLEGFQNNYGTNQPESIIKWWWERNLANVPKPPAEGYGQFEVLKPDVDAFLNPGHNPQIIWIGHATLLLRIGGKTLITDPHLTQRASPFDFVGPKRKVPPALSFEELPPIDYVLISHNHYDHLDLESVVAIDKIQEGKAVFMVPLGMKPWFKDQGIENVIELDWYQNQSFDSLDIRFLPAQHHSMRKPLGLDRNEALWGSWLVDSKKFSFFFAGDTGYSKDFKDIGARFGPIDLAALPIGAYEPRWFMKHWHVNPEEAVQMHRDLKAKRSLAIHWGTFEMTDESLDQPPRALQEALKRENIHPEKFLLVRHGQRIELLGPENTPVQSTD